MSRAPGCGVGDAGPRKASGTIFSCFEPGVDLTSSLGGLPESLSRKKFDVRLIALKPGEEQKTLDTALMLYDACFDHKLDRNSLIVALGGGVVGDISGFAAATYQRGVHYIQLPTTLLAQVDSSVGGKTGVNHPRGKNMIGAFHQPRCVIADTDTLATLPGREFAAGLAEVVKYGLIGDRDFYAWLHTWQVALAERDPAVLAEAIRRSRAGASGIS